MKPSILLTGVTGTVGRELAHLLNEREIPFKGAVRQAGKDLGYAFGESVEFDFERNETFKNALTGVEKIFLMRPPALANPVYFQAFIKEAVHYGIKHIVFLSLLGAESLFFVPHRKIEKLILQADMPYTFLRPSFFMQNLNTTHLQEIRDEHHIYVPAGRGRTSFIDVRDIAQVASKALTEPGHLNRAYNLTGSEALTYYEVAQQMTDIWDTRIVYANPSVREFKAYWKKRGLSADPINVMTGIYFTAKIGFAQKITPDLPQLLGREPISMLQYVKEYRSCFVSDC